MFDEQKSALTMISEVDTTSEERVIGRERWEEIRRLRFRERWPIATIAQSLEFDRKTVRRCVQESQWRPYRRAAREDTLLVTHREFLQGRAPQVYYSARILYQELRSQRGYAGSYETVRRFVAPLRALSAQADVTQRRFETAPGQQSQIDWGQALVSFRGGRRAVHFFVLTLGYSRRSCYIACADERLGQFLDAHEQAFEHFGGHTREHLYDRARTVCAPDGEGKVVWNSTFKAFAEYWSFEPRLCRPYRAKTKGKVESGVKYIKHNFLPGRAFVDIDDLHTQLAAWSAEIADVRIHGTTHERPIDRFQQEQSALMPTTSQPSFGLGARRSRIVASDYLVSFDTNRYSVPFNLIGQTVEVERCGGELLLYHRERLVARHPTAAGQYQLIMLPEHGPGAIARTGRQRVGQPAPKRSEHGDLDVEIRDLACYEQLVSNDEGVPA